MKWIIGTEDFNKNLDNWLFKNDQKNAEWLLKNKDKIPTNFKSFSGTLYRGMIVDHEFIKIVESGKMKFLACTSWTKDIKIARQFAFNKKYSISKNAGINIILSKKITDNSQIIDIESFVLFMGIDQLEMMGFDEMNLDSAVKEQEVLISKNLKINKKDLMLL